MVRVVGTVRNLSWNLRSISRSIDSEMDNSVLVLQWHRWTFWFFLNVVDAGLQRLSSWGIFSFLDASTHFTCANGCRLFDTKAELFIRASLLEKRF